MRGFPVGRRPQGLIEWSALATRMKDEGYTHLHLTRAEHADLMRSASVTGFELKPGALPPTIAGLIIEVADI